VLILLTDGNDTSSAITPDHAAEMAAAKEWSFIPSVSAILTPPVKPRSTCAGCNRSPSHRWQFFRAEDRNSTGSGLQHPRYPHAASGENPQPSTATRPVLVAAGAAIALVALYHLGALLWPRVSIARQRQEV
jgi:Ca-activated chloride channel family protein